jgi:hypothetical protein
MRGQENLLNVSHADEPVGFDFDESDWLDGSVRGCTDIAGFLGWSRASAYRAMGDGRLRFALIGGQRICPRRYLARFLKAGTQAQK